MKEIARKIEDMKKEYLLFEHRIEKNRLFTISA